MESSVPADYKNNDGIFSPRLEQLHGLLEAARAEHAQWAASLVEAIAGDGTAARPDVAPDAHRRCALDRWCREASPSPEQDPERSRIDLLHRELHAQAREALLAHERGEAQAWQRLGALARLSGELDAGISNLLRGTAQSLAGAARLAHAAFEHSTEGVMITDGRGVIGYVNPLFSRITGFTAGEVVGATPRLFRSGLHDGAFYEGLWRQLAELGHWEGEIWNRRKSGELYLAWLSITRVGDARAEFRYVASFLDVTSRHSGALDRLAYYDSLTGLPNRVLYQERLAQALALARRQEQMVGLLFIDLDRFKPINDSLGHSAGDAVLVEVGRRLQGAVRESDTAARISGDEFVVVLTGIRQAEDAVTAARKISELLALPFSVAGHELVLVASIGIAIYPDHGEDVDALTQSADVAMYDAKRQGGNRFRVFRPALRAANASLFAMGLSLRRALERGEFRLYYQPLVRLNSGQTVGVEALLRWQHPEEGVVLPERFMPLAEQNGSIVDIGEWALRTACRDAKSWQDAGQFLPVSVNVSSRQLIQRDFAERVIVALDESGLDPQWLYLELSEAALLEDPDHVIGLLRQLKSIGVRIAIDNFGNSRSSFAYLWRFPVDTLKIDQSLFRSVSGSGSERALAKAVFDLARALELEVVAEGVETLEQLLFVKRHVNCDAQGFYFAEPVPADELLPLLRRGPWS